MTAQQKTPLAGGAGNTAFDGEIVAEVPKNRREVYRVMARTFKGYRLADIRVWFDDPDTGELRPGKGVSIKADALPAIVEALAGLVKGGKP
jgi:hypothetical protein